MFEINENHAHYAKAALENVRRAYPNYVQHYLPEGPEMLDPAALHPVFYGSYDWHSCVHMYWSLTRLMNLASGSPESVHAAETALLFDQQFTVEKAEQELAYFQGPGRAHWERPYGWAWVLRLYAELMICTHPHAAQWRAGLRPLADYLADATFDHLETAPGPVRHGVHSNSAFAMVLALRYARTVGDDEFAALIATTAKRWFGEDRHYRLAFDLSVEDFLSPALTESLLMSQVLSFTEFKDWFDAFLPELKSGDFTHLHPARVHNERDAKQVHNHGLNLSRAWCLRGLMEPLGAGDPRWRPFGEISGEHERAATAVITGGDYVSTHWLISFALLAETEFES